MAERVRWWCQPNTWVSVLSYDPHFSRDKCRSSILTCAYLDPMWAWTTFVHENDFLRINSQIRHLEIKFQTLVFMIFIKFLALVVLIGLYFQIFGTNLVSSKYTKKSSLLANCRMEGCGVLHCFSRCSGDFAFM